MSNSTRKLGIWSAVLSAAFSVLWFITYNLRDVLGSGLVWVVGAPAAFVLLAVLFQRYSNLRNQNRP